ncbi:hypothetical protein FN846DRAFT_325584 [Sphaerosporella brunnea]|uniref:Glutamine amidotransferase domain-containing protein n=1 Tax=Sphaerosporella brunnea TaxID=1250544 RepID=A0A5J5EKB3_9PEZI|nr:hypothetical protein FN846DRAFT_325584 [Sphaerosporella brunnea]
MPHVSTFANLEAACFCPPPTGHGRDIVNMCIQALQPSTYVLYQYLIQDIQNTTVLITGSKPDANGDAEWILRLDARKQNPQTRFTGVCFGHQSLARPLHVPA